MAASSGFWRPLSYRPIRRLLLAQIPADFADWLDFVAIGAVIVYGLNEGPWVLALASVAIGLPYILIGPIAGLAVDQMDLKRAMVLANLGRSGATLGLFFAPDVATLLGLIFLKGAADSLFTPAKQSAIAALCTDEALPATNALSHSINQTSKVLGPAIGGLLFQVMEARSAFLAGASLSLIAALIALGLPAEMRPRARRAARQVGRDLLLGLQHFRGNPLLLAALTAMAISLLAIFLYDTLLPLLSDHLGFGPSVYALSITAVGLGGVIGAVAIGQVGDRIRPIIWMGLGALPSGAMLAVIGHMAAGDLRGSPTVVTGLFGMIGVTTAMLMVPYRIVLQRETPPGLLGRVVSVGEAVTTLAMVSGPFLGAAMADIGGLPLPFLVGGYAMVLTGLVLLTRRPSSPATRRNKV